MQAEKYERLFGEPRILKDDSQIEEGQIDNSSFPRAQAIELNQADIGISKKKNRSKDGVDDESKSLIKGQALDTESKLSIDKREKSK